MRAALISFSLLLGACPSDVDLCGGAPVCGEDGVIYADHCQAGAAGVQVVSPDHCGGMCPVVTCDAIECPGGYVFDSAGCMTCECIIDDAGRVDAAFDGGRACPAGLVRCADDDTCTDPDECCARLVCPAGENSTVLGCSDGVCQYECDEGYADCAPDLAGCETPLYTDDDCLACNDCGRRMPPPGASYLCEPSAGCQAVCIEPMAACDGADPSTGCFTDTTIDRAHCGGCDASCAARQACVSSDCVPCEGGQLACDGGCKDPNDPSHCGSCTNVCDADEVCAGQACIPETCSSPTAWNCDTSGGPGCTCTCAGAPDITFDTDGGPVVCPHASTLCNSPVGAECLTGIASVRCCLGIDG